MILPLKWDLMELCSEDDGNKEVDVGMSAIRTRDADGAKLLLALRSSSSIHYAPPI
jgi:hypothetical protein